MDWKQASVLVTGGTGSFGKKFAEVMLSKLRPRRLIVFSRDELKQFEMKRGIYERRQSPLRFFIGDVRDRERLYRAFRGVDVVIHAAALKHVDTGEYNPLEVIKTNVIGASNIIDAAVDSGVKKVIALSTDKAVNPVNLYGATKLCADKLFVSAGVYAGAKDTQFSVVRYGNVVASRGSVIPFFQERRSTGVLPITDPRMTRFWITLDEAVDFVVRCLELMQGGEIFVPKLPSMRVIDLARAIAPEARHEIVGIRPGEKLHEVLLTEDDSRRTLRLKDMYVVKPGEIMPDWKNRALNGAKPVPEGFSYSSDNNEWQLTVPELRKMAGLEETTLYPLEAKVG
jgi:UDP-N-acetylglucosamine 4,6-dehydratase